jgi:hypothetical protein
MLCPEGNIVLMLCPGYCEHIIRKKCQFIIIMLPPLLPRSNIFHHYLYPNICRDHPKQIVIVQNNTEFNIVFMNGLGNVLDGHGKRTVQ